MKTHEDNHLLRFYIELTPRQRDVLALVSLGLTNRQVAERLHIAPSVVAEHLTGIYTQLEMAQLVEPDLAANRYQVVSLFADFLRRHPEIQG